MEISLWNPEFWWKSPALLGGAGVLLFLIGTWSERLLERKRDELPAFWPYLKEAAVASYSLAPAFAGISFALIFPSALGVDSAVWLPRVFKGLGMFFVLFLLWIGFVALLEGHATMDPWWKGLRNGLYYQAHWGFYRGIAAMTGIGVYAATWVGAAVAIVEWVVAGLAVGFPDRSRAAKHLGILIATSALFFYSRNLWLCMMFHWMASSIL